MDRTISARASLRRLFRAGLTAADLAEYLLSYDCSRPVDEVRRRMELRDFDIVGARDEGFVIGFVVRDDLREGTLRDHLRYFGSNQIVADETPLPEVVGALHGEPCVFVTVLGGVGGIITRADLQKPPMRMWLFGLITVLEQAFGQILESRYPGGSWREHLSEGRLRLAEKLQDERRRRNESLDLASCLQLVDKAHILFKDDEIRRLLGIESRSQAKDVIKNLERLRNSLAHSQDIVAGSWETILGVTESLDRVLRLHDR
jgi:hypothetical protein